jgi:flagellar hook-length control protein FliK
MLAGKNDFLKLSKDISYFDLTSRIKTDSKKSQNEKSSVQNVEIKNNENLSLSKDNSPFEKVENIELKPDDNKLGQNEEVKKSNYVDRVSKTSQTETKETNEVSKNQNIEINTISNNKTNNQTNNTQVNRTTFNNPINLRDFNAQITDIINQKSTENTFREIVTIKVNPPDLGNVDVEIMKSGKTISISVLTENENAKNFITRTIQSLIGSLRDQGFNPVNVKVETAPEPDLMDTEKQDEQNNEQEQHTEENNEEKEFENILRGEENV